MKDEIVRLLKTEQVRTDVFQMTFRAPYIAKNAKPGNFLNFKIEGNKAPYLRRPFGVFDVDTEKGTIDILFKVLGDGTKALGETKEGKELSCLGPLGEGVFNVNPKTKNHILVAGGMGIPPLYFLARTLVAKKIMPALIFGARSEIDLIAKEKIERLGIEVLAATDDGSCGKKCFAGDVLDDIMNEKKLADVTVYACGPALMLKHTAEIAKKHHIPAQVSMEERMGCGYGVCFGCSVKVRGQTTDYLRVCKNGPVFLSDIIEWEAIA